MNAYIRGRSFETPIFKREKGFANLSLGLAYYSKASAQIAIS
jgi:hypothetical protein